jgi:transposase
VEALIPREGGVMSAPKKYPVELRDRSIRLVQDLLAEPDLELSVTAACTRVAQQLGINRDTLRGWVKQAEIDAGAKPGLSTNDRRRLVELERENRELRRANAILKTASAFFAAELDRPSPRS